MKLFVHADPHTYANVCEKLVYIFLYNIHTQDIILNVNILVFVGYYGYYLILFFV